MTPRTRLPHKHHFLAALLGLLLSAPLGSAAPPATEAERLLYAQHIARAQLEWMGGDVAQLMRLLEACPPALRHWEWHYLQRLAEGAAFTFHGHRSPVTATAWGPDGRRVASGDQDGTVHVWDPETGQIFLTLHGHSGGVGALAFSPDGKYLVTSNGKFSSGSTGSKVVEPSKVRVWEAASGRLVKTYTEHGGLVEQLAFRPDGKALVVLSWPKVGDPSTLYVWDLETDKTANKLALANGAGFLGIRPDGQLVMLAPRAREKDPRRVQLLDGGTLKVLRSWDVPEGMVNVNSLRPDGRRLVGTVVDPQTYQVTHLIVWNADTGEEVLRASARGWLPYYSGDGKRLILGEDDGVSIRDAETGKQLRILRDREQSAGQPLSSPDGRRLLTTPQHFVPPYETFFGAVKVWDLGTAATEHRTLADHRGKVQALAFSPDGRRFASGDAEGTVLLRDGATAEPPHALPQKDGKVRLLRFTPDGLQLLVVSQKFVKTWDTATGKESRAVEVGDSGWQAVSPDGKWLASADMIRTLDADQSLPLAHVEGNGLIGMDFSPDGKFLVAGYGGIPGTLVDGNWGEHLVVDNTSPGAVVVWDTATGKEVRRLKGLRGYVWPHRPVFSPDGKLVAAACSSWGIQVWDAATGEPRLRLPGREQGDDGGLSFSPDGRRLFVANAHAVDVWDLSTSQQVLALPGAGTAVALSPDGMHLAVGDRDVVRLYDGALALAPAPALRREAVAHVQALYDQGLLREEVLARLEKEGERGEGFRTVAREMARDSAENAEALREAAWAVVRKRGGKEADYRAALARAERAVQMNPDDPRAKLAVGAGYYRLGDYKKSAKVLATASAVQWQGVTATIEIRPREVMAFLGLANYQLGGGEAAVASGNLTVFMQFVKLQEESLDKYRTERGEQDAAVVARRLHLEDQRDLVPEVEEVLKKLKEE